MNDQLTAKQRAHLDKMVKILGPTMPDKPRYAALTPPEYQRGPADDEYERDDLIIENRALRRRLQMLAEREQQRHRTPTIKPR
jgi:hypothetical protein